MRLLGGLQQHTELLIVVNVKLRCANDAIADSYDYVVPVVLPKIGPEFLFVAGTFTLKSWLECRQVK